MHLQVFAQFLLPPEGGAAERTAEVVDVTMTQQVRLQLIAVSELLVAHVARVQLFLLR